MRKITNVIREKTIWNISITELKKGKWLELIPNSDMVEISFKKGYLTIADCDIKKIREGGEK